jgi:hypothetical protein
VSEAPPDRPFTRKALIDGETVVGARWWQESLRLSSEPLSRRRALKGLLLVLGGSAAGLGLFAALSRPADELDISMDALDLQRREGWNAGQAGAALRFPGATASDAEGGRGWVDGLATLASDLAPAQASLAPFYVPTLFQALAAASNASLRSAMTPVAPRAGGMDVLRGKSILSLFEAVKIPADTAVILDLDGPMAVAVAAGMAPGFDPVFVFDNWPHPLGVVASHLTLGAVLYHRPTFLRARRARAVPAPPVFVLDRNRLAHYADEDDQFDNRYVARLPTATSLRELGIRHVLYVPPDKSDMRELDDLNDDFVALAAASIDVKSMPLTDLDAPAAPGHSAPATFYYGGVPHTHLWFWSSYGWHTPQVQAQRATVRPSNVSAGAAYRPALRPTIFSSRTLGGGTGIGKQKPTGFGRVSVRASRSTGSITGIRSGRSGSFGRAGGRSGG